MPPAPRPQIAYITKMFPRFSETFILSEILELERTGMDVRIFSLKLPTDARRHADVSRVRASVIYVPEVSPGSVRAFLGPHLEVFRAHPASYLLTAADAARRSARSRSWSALKRFAQAGYIGARLRRAGISHVHAHFATSATSVARDLRGLLGTSYSFTAHAKDIFIDSMSRTSLIQKLRQARFVVTVSNYNVRYLRALEPGATIHRVYNGLDLDIFRPHPPRPQEPPLLLAVGRLVEKKGFDDLIRACAQLRDRDVPFRCEIVGAGGEGARLDALIAAHDLTDRVRLAGPMPREELIHLYPQASVFVAPCVVGADGNRDGLPTVLIEAMALGVPVVATPVTGIPEIVHDGETGTIVPERDPEALADALERVLANPDDARRMAAAGRVLVEREFDLRANVATVRKLLAEASAA
ncbi:MAG: glycosyltransferase [Thermomicrobiales bacterium]|nr:glycosyltransferase [Thermomicrobiales bacterium]